MGHLAPHLQPRPTERSPGANATSPCLVAVHIASTIACARCSVKPCYCGHVVNAGPLIAELATDTGHITRNTRAAIAISSTFHHTKKLHAARRLGRADSRCAYTWTQNSRQGGTAIHLVLTHLLQYVESRLWPNATSNPSPESTELPSTSARQLPQAGSAAVADLACN